jgi:hypothetical protein
MKKHLIILVLFLIVPNLSFAKQLSKSFFIPDSVLNEFNSLSKEHKINVCFKNFDPFIDKINEGLPMKIEGYNSKMDNTNRVKGTRSMSVLREFASATNYAFISENLELQEFLFNKLSEWAIEKALTKTRVCYTNIKGNFILDDCEGYWQDPMGQDLAPTHDSSRTIEVIFGLNYLYNFWFIDYKENDSRHKTINEWFKPFHKRIKNVNDLDGMGDHGGQFFPNLLIKHSQNKQYKNLVKKLIKGQDVLLQNDGSIKDRTTRGNRALWYHHAGIGVAFVAMEIAKAADVKLPKNYEKKLLKAVELFHDASLDHSVIEPWAKKKHNSHTSNGKQDYKSDFNSTSHDSAWYHIIQYRYPNHRTSNFIKENMYPRATSLKADQKYGISLGCIYNALANK